MLCDERIYYFLAFVKVPRLLALLHGNFISDLLSNDSARLLIVRQVIEVVKLVDLIKNIFNLSLLSLLLVCHIQAVLCFVVNLDR